MLEFWGLHQPPVINLYQTYILHTYPFLNPPPPPPISHQPSIICMYVRRYTYSVYWLLYRFFNFFYFKKGRCYYHFKLAIPVSYSNTSWYIASCKKLSHMTTYVAVVIINFSFTSVHRSKLSLNYLFSETKQKPNCAIKNVGGNEWDDKDTEFFFSFFPPPDRPLERCPSCLINLNDWKNESGESGMYCTPYCTYNTVYT